MVVAFMESNCEHVIQLAVRGEWPKTSINLLQFEMKQKTTKLFDT